jgi:hypothetical protein
MTEDMQSPPEGADPSTFEPSDAAGSILQNLRNFPLFEALVDEEFRAVAKLLRTQHVARGLLVIEQGGLNHRLYIVRRGRALKRVIDADDIERRVGKITVGEVFNQTSFLRGERNAETIEALDDLTLWYISREDFHKLLVEYPAIEFRVTAPSSEDASDASDAADAPGEQLVTRTSLDYSWQRPNEHVILYRKKHVIVFINRLWPGIIALIVIAALLLPPVVAILQQALGWLILAVIVMFLIWLVMAWVDWQNDYYAITDQRVIHRERVVLIRDEQDEVPLSLIQDVKIDRPSFFASVIDIGNVTIEASGSRSRVRFEDVGKPEEVGKILFDQLARTRVESHATQRAHIRLDLRRELGLAPPLPAMAPKPPPQKPPSLEFGKRLSIFGEQVGMIRNGLMPRLRLEVGDTITYRKHWLRLLQTVAAPVLLALFYAGLLVIIRINSLSLSDIVFSFPVILVVFGLGLVLLSAVAYRYEDWRNDIYIVKPDRLIDITRSPFGLRGTTRQEAKMGAVQNVMSKTGGVLDNVFNVGDVIIQTAGSDGQLVFERVYNPRGVQRDITDRMDAYETQQREKGAAQRRKEMTEWLGIYDELTRLHDRDKLL